MIRDGRCISASQAAEELEVKARTIMRDFDLLRDRFSAPLKYSSKSRRWIYTEATFSLPVTKLTEGELISIFLAERLMGQYQGTSIEETLKRAFKKICEILPEQISIDWSTIDSTFSFDIGPIAEVSINIFEAISQAAMQYRTLEISYFTQSRGELTQRRIDPYHIHNQKGDWYVIAFDHLRGAIRDFHLSRIRSFTITKDRFKVRADFNLGVYLSSGFSMIKGETIYDVEIEFDSYQARWIRERSKWHPSEEREELADGRVILRWKLAGLEAVMRFALQYGSHAIVHKPLKLRQMIKEEIERMTILYSNNQ
jgi:predicted DNA-binding transcriptional regulator YafY